MPFKLTYQSFPSPNGPLQYAKVPWDSELYGFPFYELKCDNIPSEVLDKYLSTWLSDLPINCQCLVYTKIPSISVALNKVLVSHGFYPIETLFELHLPLGRFKPIRLRQDIHSNLSLMEESELPEVIKIAKSAFSKDRLHIDPHLPPDKAGERYARGVEKGFQEGDKIFTYKEKTIGKILGFVHIQEDSKKTVTLNLGAVDITYQGTGIGVLIYQNVLEECKALGYQAANTRISGNNLAVINLLVSLGFKFHKAFQISHWFRAPWK